MTVQPRTSTVIDPGLTAVEMGGASSYLSSWFYNTSIQANLQCRILAPTEVSSPTALAPLVFTSRTDLAWEDRSVNHAESFNLYRGDIAGLPLGDSGSCLGTIPSNGYTDLDEPGYGEGWFYLVTGRNALGEGSMGKNSLGQDRTNVFPCP